MEVSSSMKFIDISSSFSIKLLRIYMPVEMTLPKDIVPWERHVLYSSRKGGKCIRYLPVHLGLDQRYSHEHDIMHLTSCRMRLCATNWNHTEKIRRWTRRAEASKRWKFATKRDQRRRMVDQWHMHGRSTLKAVIISLAGVFRDFSFMIGISGALGCCIEPL